MPTLFARISGSVFLCWLFVGHAAAQPNLQVAYSVLNSASYDRASIAQGSLFVVFGTNIGPAQLVQSGFPLPTQIGGTAITVMSGSTKLSCPMVYSVAGQVAAILPSSTLPGTAMLTVSYNGTQSPYPVLISVVPSAVGLYTLNSSGLGPGIFTALDNSVKNFTTTAKPGEVVTAWATGVGPISGPDNVLPSSFPSFPGVEVFVGTQSAKLIYAGRSGCCLGVDQISFEVPQGLAGCYQPVTVRSNGRLSNFVTLAVNSAGSTCSDTAPTVPVSVVNRATAGQPVKTAALAIGPVSLLRGIGFNPRQYLVQRLSTLLRVKVSEQDISTLLRAMQVKNQHALARAMAKFAAPWKALDPVSRAAVRAALNPSQEGAAAGFGQYSNAGFPAAVAGTQFPSQGACTVVNTALGTDIFSTGTSSKGLDAGPLLSLSGQAGSWMLSLSSTGEYQTLFGSIPAGPNVPPGNYVISGTGGKDIGAFSSPLSVSGNVTWTNKSSISTVDRSQPLTVTWSGAGAGSVLLGGYSGSRGQAPIDFVCAEDGAKGSFTIPSFILSALPAATNGGVMFIAPHPLSHQVTIPGIDLAYFMDASSDSKSVGYR